MSERELLVLDAGTSSTRAIRYAPDGRVLGQCSRDIVQHYPGPGLVEHDAAEIWTKTLGCARQMVAEAGGPDRIAAIGITNQRETVVAWRRSTGEPLARAIVWQDRRTADRCRILREAGHEPQLQQRTGLRLDPYFSATKMGWLLANDAAVSSAGSDLALGTIETWLAWKLTGRQLTDASNASRTLLLDLEGKDWEPELLTLFGVPRAALGEVVGNAGNFGSTMPALFGAPIPLTALVGDQQSATIGQACLAPGQTKLTLGTGAFVLTNRGTARPQAAEGLLGTVLCELGGARQFALEGAIFVAGSLIKWLRDNLGIVRSAAETDALARSVPDNGGVAILPALSGLGAPYWKPDATAAITGLSFAATRAHVARAALETVSHQLVDLAAAFAAADCPWHDLRIDGGMAANDWLAQDIADMTGLAVGRPSDVETTARGAAILAAVGAGLYPDLALAAAAMTPSRDHFAPRDIGAERSTRLAAWRRLVDQA
ncbi:FGGY family carbohydrate kinase [Sphingomonas astaxanthinifaciens]|uniref:Glycerol kinase n=1 Tax=Sphingomonas astaxanthinifaciens DSM 22298 TaxID=1123267 RepID=A0ABQ5Z615_9SPHN|nr:FGGY family carbohydrate kinase [Sphingomonas astaxanthinifaciens]GLR48143.1 glycerol kinase [Sphingomonas astaxanthinifaciens DSM 22298]